MQLRKALNPKTFDPTSLKVAVLGGGSFGTAMACALGRKGVQVQLIVRKPAVVEEINANRTNPYYQKGLLLPDTVSATLDPVEAFDGCDFISTPCPSVPRATLEKVGPPMPAGVPVISLSKGRDVDALPDVRRPHRVLGATALPTSGLFAAEIVNGIVTAVTIACTIATSRSTCTPVDQLRALYTPDVIGVEVGGAIKNVIAIAPAPRGLGLGTNAMAASDADAPRCAVVVMMGGGRRRPSPASATPSARASPAAQPASRDPAGPGREHRRHPAGTTRSPRASRRAALKRLLDKGARPARALDAMAWTHTQLFHAALHATTHVLPFCR